jgi:Leucine-rich repeat (LRR) protein
MIPRAEWRILYLFCVFSMLSFLAVGFPVSQAPCFASWSHSELETYALAAWSSSVLIPTPLDASACPSASVKQASMVNELQQGAIDLNILAEESQEAAGAASTLADAAMSSALMTLYDSTNGPSWVQRWNWGDTSMSACRWYGVCCNATYEEFSSCPNPDWETGDFTGSCCTPSGIVTNLILIENNLRGSVPPALGELNYLQALAFGSNHLSGTIPSELGQLFSLRRLNLTSNQLSGTIPSELGQLSPMIVLDFSFNELSGTIPSELGQLSQLGILFLYSNQLSGTIPSELGQLSAMIELNLASNQLSGTIPSELGQLSAMIALSFVANELSGTIPSELGQLSAMIELNLGYNQLSGTIPSELGQLSQLNVLFLYSNQLSGTIPSELGQLSQLNALFLFSNELSGTIPSELGQLSPMNMLDFSFNELSGTIPSELGQLYNLKRLNLGYNQLSGTIPSELGKMPSLTFLDLSVNHLSGAVGGSWESLSLSTLYLNDNSFSELISLPGNLVSFSAARCALRGSAAPLGNLRLASFIDVQDNPSLSGEIPAVLLDSPFLLFLFISNTAMQSAEAGYSPGLNLDSNQPQTFGTGDDRYECPVVHSEASENAFLSISPFYFSYSGCYCGVGFSGPHVDNGVATCKRCSPGTYNGKEENTACSECPPSTFSRTEGSLQCTSCALPLQLVINDGTECLDLTGFYVLSLLFIIMLVAVLLALSIALAASVGVGYHLLKAWRARELRQLTLLIQKRARDEIPADLLIRYRDLQIETVIGAGSFARVYKGKWNHTLVAIKELTGVHALMATLEAERNASISEADSQQDEGIQKLVNEFRSEVLVMSRLHHPNVLLLVGACSEFPNLCIVTEFLPNGSLYDALHKKSARDTITQKQQMQWLLETASGMAYLHEQGLIHRDLKSLNVLLDDLNRAKLCDFGLAKIVGDAQRTMTSGVGSLLWMPPEVLQCDSYSFSADVYSWGIMAWEIMSPEEELFPGLSTYEVAKQIVAGHRPKVNPVWSYCVCQLMQHCWRGEKEERPTFLEVMVQLEEVVQPEAKDDAMRGDGKDMGLATPLLQM